MTRKRFDHINQRIVAARHNCGRSADVPVTLLAVSKYHSWDKIQALYQLGQREFGESYVQEALKKIKQSPYKDIVWHFIGPIQSNKTKDIAQHFHWVHSVDRLKIARRLSAQRISGSALNVCLQVNISQEAQKSGFSSDEIMAAMPEIIKLPHLKIRGLMTIPKPSDDPAEQALAFKQLRELMQQLNQQFNLQMDTLSMGMSRDLEAAITEGATIVRIGTALFGPRQS